MAAVTLDGYRVQNGFTLIELMLVVAVAAVIASLALPSLDRFADRNRIESTANELVAHINLARLEAVMHRRVVVVCPSTDGQRCSGGNQWHHGWIVFRDDDRNDVADRVEDLLRVGPVRKRLWMDSAGRKRIRYQPDGTAGGSNLSIKLCDLEHADLAHAVIVSNPGRPRVAPLPRHLSCPVG
ncbi:MAG: GspH/FimT family pseudopilin [Wenzhouxiangellaceae bacterium]